ncbi:unnamed protein product [Paramecium sonneborni]|uniref:Uncharacterized protein n=1 Tax=Paramecium sonneborni TaxID=65129 RepID=A0A8S1N4B2_9CILI|nr:unnamed protein product [Paramecium sonneborni]CAD8087260.1 unnamed protein product [Paramecium sonneborni]
MVYNCKIESQETKERLDLHIIVEPNNDLAQLQLLIKKFRQRNLLSMEQYLIEIKFIFHFEFFLKQSFNIKT